MPAFTIETTFDLPAYRQRTYEAPTAEAAMALALADDNWDGQKVDYETTGPSRITGAWIGADAAYKGEAVPFTPTFEIVAPGMGGTGIEIWRNGGAICYMRHDTEATRRDFEEIVGALTARYSRTSASDVLVVIGHRIAELRKSIVQMAAMTDDREAEIIGDCLNDQVTSLERIRVMLQPEASTPSALEFRKALVLSTAHVSSATADLLDAAGVSDWPGTGGHYGEYGWFFYCPRKLDEIGENGKPVVADDESIPDDLKAVMQFALNHGCDNLLLDRDAETTDELPAFER